MLLRMLCTSYSCLYVVRTSQIAPLLPVTKPCLYGQKSRFFRSKLLDMYVHRYKGPQAYKSSLSVGMLIGPSETKKYPQRDTLPIYLVPQGYDMYIILYILNLSLLYELSRYRDIYIFFLSSNSFYPVYYIYIYIIFKPSFLSGKFVSIFFF